MSLRAREAGCQAADQHAALPGHTHFMAVTPDTSHLERSPLNEEALRNIALRAREAGCQAADQHAALPWPHALHVLYPRHVPLGEVPVK